MTEAGEMMKKRINIGFSGMAGFGPKAWDRDESKVSMYTVHPHHHKKHHVKHGPASDSRKEDAERHQPRN
ncbi:MAG TPA: hypothetical protein VLL07_03255 [Pontiella sp.]|nr:hypothetical protein [Pontiella sp.]